MRIIVRHKICMYIPLWTKLVTLGGGWDWRIPGCMCEWMFGGMCAGVVCEDMLFCTMSVLRNVDVTLGGERDW